MSGLQLVSERCCSHKIADRRNNGQPVKRPGEKVKCGTYQMNDHICDYCKIIFLLHQITQTRPGSPGPATWRRLVLRQWPLTPLKW